MENLQCWVWNNLKMPKEFKRKRSESKFNNSNIELSPYTGHHYKNIPKPSMLCSNSLKASDLRS